MKTLIFCLKLSVLSILITSSTISCTHLKITAPQLKNNDQNDTIIRNKPTVIPILYSVTHNEYVDPSDGSVGYQVYTKDGILVGAGVKISRMPGIVPDKEYITNQYGEFRVRATDLPINKPIAERTGAAMITWQNNQSEYSMPNTIVPNRVTTRLTAELVYPRQYSYAPWIKSDINNHFVAIHYKYERCINGVWTEFPDDYPAPELKVVKIIVAAQPLTFDNVDSSAVVAEKWQALPQGEYARSKTILIRRPVVLTEAEKIGNPVDNNWQNLNNNLIELKTIEWNGRTNYFSAYGFKNFYGEKPLMDAVIHVPEIYPNFEIKEVKIHLAEGMSELWGKISIQNYPIYLSYTKPTAPQNKWEITKIMPSELLGERFKNNSGVSQVNLRIAMTKTEANNSIGSTSIDKRYNNADNETLNFQLGSAYADNAIFTTMWIYDRYGRITQDTEDRRILSSAYLAYRTVPLYFLRKRVTGIFTSYYLEQIYNNSNTVNVPKK